MKKLIFAIIFLMGFQFLAQPNPAAQAEASVAPVAAINNDPRILAVTNEIKSSATLSAAQNEYSVFIYGDPQTFAPYREGREIHRIETVFGSPVLAYHASSGPDFISILKNLTTLKTKIKNLVVRGIHGGTYEAIPSFEVTDEAHGDFEALGFEDLQKAGVNLNFTPDSFVFFDSCAMVDAKNLTTIEVPFSEMKKIGFQTGWIYFNATDGAYGVENTFEVPFYDHPGTWKEKAQMAAAQAAWPVVLPYFMYLDNKNNQGYLRGNSASHEVLMKVGSKEVENGRYQGQVIFSK